LPGGRCAISAPRPGRRRPPPRTRLNPLGAKGIGEGGAIATPAAVGNAVADALAPFGIGHVDPPFTEAKLWRLLREGSR
jgi:aerobic carbon-monoxide dehydrogenase large subunit